MTPSNESSRSGSVHHRLVLLLIVLGLGLPLLLGWFMIISPGSVSPQEARQRLSNSETHLVAVDSRVLTAFPHATLWPMGEIQRVQSLDEVPMDYRTKDVLLVCPGGIQSSLAARHLRRLGMLNVHGIRGGLQAWISEPDGNNPSLDGPFFRPSPLPEQAAAILSFFGVKAIYSLLSAALIFLLWREKATDLSALRRSLILFFIGEAFCFVNVMGFGDQNLLLEHLHSAGMVLSLAFGTFSLLEGLDARLIHFSDESRCAALGLCKTCIKHAPVPCGLRRLFLLTIPGLIITAALPLFSPFRETAYTTRIFGVLHGYRHPVVHQLYELRLLPLVAILFLGACFLVLLFVEHRRVEISKLLLSAAAGALTFSYFRLLLVSAFIDHQVWFATWEETSELIFVATVAGILLVFHRSLLTAFPMTSQP